MIKSASDFKNSAIENNIDYWPIHDCSMCNYECGYLFFQYENYEVVYDSGCDCTNSRTKHARNWEYVAEQYNYNIKNKSVIKKYNEYWKFNN